jgi:hypothetical protein
MENIYGFHSGSHQITSRNDNLIDLTWIS